MSTLYVYRVVVTKWPTTDGKPWGRFIAASQDDDGWISEAYPGDPRAEPLDWVPFDSEGGWPDELSHRIRDHDTEGPYGTVMEQGVLDGMVLPDPNRRHWFARHAAEAWVRDARLLGAECHIETGRVEWAVTP